MMDIDISYLGSIWGIRRTRTVHSRTPYPMDRNDPRVKEAVQVVADFLKNSGKIDIRKLPDRDRNSIYDRGYKCWMELDITDGVNTDGAQIRIRTANYQQIELSDPVAADNESLKPIITLMATKRLPVGTHIFGFCTPRG